MPPIFVRPEGLLNCAIAIWASFWRTSFVYVPVITPVLSISTLASVPAACPSASAAIVDVPEYCVIAARLSATCCGAAPFSYVRFSDADPLTYAPDVSNFRSVFVSAIVVVVPSASVILNESPPLPSASVHLLFDAFVKTTGTECFAPSES